MNFSPQIHPPKILKSVPMVRIRKPCNSRLQQNVHLRIGNKLRQERKTPSWKKHAFNSESTADEFGFSKISFVWITGHQISRHHSGWNSKKNFTTGSSMSQISDRSLETLMSIRRVWELKSKICMDFLLTKKFTESVHFNEKNTMV